MIGDDDASRDRAGADEIRVAVSGAGMMGAACAKQVALTPGLRLVAIVNRTRARAEAAAQAAGIEWAPAHKPEEATNAIEAGRCAITQGPEQLLAPDVPVDAIVEATCDVERGAATVLAAASAKRPIIMMNAESDELLGPALARIAGEAGVVYTSADGDQPGVLARLHEEASLAGFEIVCFINCKGYMDPYASPADVAEWAQRQGTSPTMTTAFSDGTKMNIECAIVANALNALPLQRGMRGFAATRGSVLPLYQDAAQVGVVPFIDYTLGGDFGGSVHIAVRHPDSTWANPLLRYLKLGDGPLYLLERPHHLCHFELPRTVFEVVRDGRSLLSPPAIRRTQVIAMAKRGLISGEALDGAGGKTAYGQIDVLEQSRGLLPIGLSAGATARRAIARDEAISLEDVELAISPWIVDLWRSTLGEDAETAAGAKTTSASRR